MAEPLGPPGEWQVNQWLKKAVLLAFRVHDNEVIEAGHTRFFDKLPLRWGGEDRRHRRDRRPRGAAGDGAAGSVMLAATRC